MDVCAVRYLSHHYDCAGYWDWSDTGDVANQDGYCGLASTFHRFGTFILTAVVEPGFNEVHMVDGGEDTGTKALTGHMDGIASFESDDNEDSPTTINNE